MRATWPAHHRPAVPKPVRSAASGNVCPVKRLRHQAVVPCWPDALGTSPAAATGGDMRKYVFSSTLTAAEWNNTTIIPGDPVAAVRELKEQGDRHLVIYGYGQLPQTLLEHGLVDQLNFVINPVMVGCVWLVTDTRTDRANLSGSAGVVFDPVAVEADGNPG